MQCRMIQYREGAPFIPEEKVIYYLSGRIEADKVGFYLALREVIGLSREVRIVYPPFLVGGLGPDVLAYNFPMVKASFLDSMDFYRDAYAFLGVAPQPHSRHIVRYDLSSRAFLCFDLSASTDEEFFGNLRSTAPYIAPWNDDQYPSLCSIVSGRDLLESLPESMQIAELTKISRNMSLSADERYEADQLLAGLKVKNDIQKLVMDNFPVAVILRWIRDAQKLSRLVITSDYRILLADYDREVVLHPLEKTVYLFYLRHEEGCRFKDLGDHRDELQAIYDDVSGVRSPAKARKSIDDLCNIWGKSINEKCSRIKKAFITMFGDSVASYYYVSGTKGGAKRITLDRSLVSWE